MADHSDASGRAIQRHYAHAETIHSDNLSNLVAELWLVEEPKSKKATLMWGRAQTALMRMGVDATRVAQVVQARDVEKLAALVKQADAGGAAGPGRGIPGAAPRPAAGGGAARAGLPSVADGRTLKEVREASAAASGKDSLEKENLKKALRAFRKKLKTTRLDDESRLGSKHTTYGKSSGITAIQPPRDYPPPVWAALVEDGRLLRAGQGLYELPEDAAKKPPKR
ncbi:hypothetical protein [Phycisphaera mikurensis]|uniref:Uncharacterized protein n=1 Tax=Phycisphaera mikurensis (strain NBRC 102666 / KCTC 22515 / FYK2301M01) TaxID=1142394 RepID=I0II49_PHYMF|nr:hypothetical protein [Phycisphaera mikurensis]MBB6442500.1 hypothetical protein [Phycisphaera mikurensis]BAM04937.1 hypothetical protein PSMK_27780 [Phycisphaera mikurensis NBRC 102666]